MAACLFDAANDTLVPVISRQAAAVGAAGREVEVQRLLQGSEEEKPGLAQCLGGAGGVQGGNRTIWEGLALLLTLT